MTNMQHRNASLSGWKRALGIGFLLFAALPVGAQQKAEPAAGQDELATQALGTALTSLAEAVRTQDDAGLDAVICNDLRSRAQLLRQAQLGLIADAEDPLAQLASRQERRQAVYSHFEKLAQSGRQINRLEVARLQFVDINTTNPESLLIVEQGNPIAYPITANGIMGVTCQPGDHVFDVAVMQVDGHWCLSLALP